MSNPADPTTELVPCEDDSPGCEDADDGAGVVEPPAEDAVLTAVAEAAAEQDSEAQRYAIEFLKKILRLRGVRIEREQFLRQELRKHGFSNAVIEQAVTTTPVHAGVDLAVLDDLARASLAFETRKSASMSFAAGLPGGFAVLASVPADVTQYYVHAFRVMQKLAFLYGWRDLLGDLDDADDETMGVLALFLGVMMGVGGAAAGLTGFAATVAAPSLQKRIARQALTKTSWYPVVKKTLSLIGVKVTKDSLAKTVAKIVPLAGGAISGAMTFGSLRGQSLRLQRHLRELPPPGVDAAEYRAALDAVRSEELHEARAAALRRRAQSVGESAKSSVGRLTVNASGMARASASSAAERLRGATGLRGLRRHSDADDGALPEDAGDAEA